MKNAGSYESPTSRRTEGDIDCGGGKCRRAEDGSQVVVRYGSSPCVSVFDSWAH